MSADVYFIIDFDSALVQVETLVLAAELVAGDAGMRESIKKITDQAMAGRMDFSSALRLRLQLLRLHRDLLPKLIERLRAEITPSFANNRAFLTAHAERIHVVTSAFQQVVKPVIETLGLKAKYVHANTLTFDSNGYINGVDWNNPLSADKGKTKVVESLKLPGEIAVVGDGWSDYEIFQAGAAQRFYAFTENVQRKEVISSSQDISRPTSMKCCTTAVFAARCPIPRTASRCCCWRTSTQMPSPPSSGKATPWRSVPGSLDEANWRRG